jgi:hypothetical protein
MRLRSTTHIFTSMYALMYAHFRLHTRSAHVHTKKTSTRTLALMYTHIHVKARNHVHLRTCTHIHALSRSSTHIHVKARNRADLRTCTHLRMRQRSPKHIQHHVNAILRHKSVINLGVHGDNQTRSDLQNSVRFLELSSLEQVRF